MGSIANLNTSFDLGFGGDTCDQVFIGRQPIVDVQQKIIGYELLFRSNAEENSAQFSDDFSAGAQVLINTLSNMGTGWLLGDKTAFLNVNTEMLNSEFMELLPAARIVGNSWRNNTYPCIARTHANAQSAWLLLCAA